MGTKRTVLALRVGWELRLRDRTQRRELLVSQVGRGRPFAEPAVIDNGPASYSRRHARDLRTVLWIDLPSDHVAGELICRVTQEPGRYD